MVTINLRVPTQADYRDGRQSLSDTRLMANKSFLLTLKGKLERLGGQTRYKACDPDTKMDSLESRCCMKDFPDAMWTIVQAADYTFCGLGSKPIDINGSVTWQQGDLTLVATIDNGKVVYCQPEVGYEVIDPSLLVSPSQIGDVDVAKEDVGIPLISLRDAVRQIGSAIGEDCSLLCDRHGKCVYVSDGKWAAPIMNLSQKGIIEAFTYLYEPSCRVEIEAARDQIRRFEQSDRLSDASPLDIAEGGREALVSYGRIGGSLDPVESSRH